MKKYKEMFNNWKQANQEFIINDSDLNSWFDKITKTRDSDVIITFNLDDYDHLFANQICTRIQCLHLPMNPNLIDTCEYSKLLREKSILVCVARLKRMHQFVIQQINQWLEQINVKKIIWIIGAEIEFGALSGTHLPWISDTQFSIHLKFPDSLKSSAFKRLLKDAKNKIRIMYETKHYADDSGSKKRSLKSSSTNDNDNQLSKRRMLLDEKTNQFYYQTKLSSSSPSSSLCSDTFSSIFDFLSRKEQLNVTYVCKDWCEMVGQVSCRKVAFNVNKIRFGFSSIDKAEETCFYIYRILGSVWTNHIVEFKNDYYLLDEKTFGYLELLPQLQKLKTRLHPVLSNEELTRMFSKPFVKRISSLYIERYGPGPSFTSTWQSQLVSVIASHANHLETLGLYIVNEPGVVDLEPLCTMKQLNTLFVDIRGGQQRLEHIEVFKKIPNLKRLLGYHRWSDESWALMSDMPFHPALEEIDLSKSRFTFTQLNKLSVFMYLTKLEICFEALSVNWESLNSLHHLKSIQFSSYHTDLNLVIPNLRQCKNLESACFEHFQWNAHFFQKILKQHKKLSHLSILSSHEWTCFANSIYYLPIVSTSLKTLTLHKCSKLDAFKTVKQLPVMIPSLQKINSGLSFSNSSGDEELKKIFSDWPVLNIQF